jgi:hypothetical protein
MSKTKLTEKDLHLLKTMREYYFPVKQIAARFNLHPQSVYELTTSRPYKRTVTPNGK